MGDGGRKGNEEEGMAKGNEKRNRKGREGTLLRGDEKANKRGGKGRGEI